METLRIRYGASAERVAVLLMVPTSVIWAAAQVRAFGGVLGAASELPTSVTITIAAGVVIAYTAAGGLLADAVIDLLQGVVLIAGLGLVAGAAILNGDGQLASLAADYRPSGARRSSVSREDGGCSLISGVGKSMSRSANA